MARTPGPVMGKQTGLALSRAGDSLVVEGLVGIVTGIQELVASFLLSG